MNCLARKEIAASILMQILPTGFVPAVETIANYDTFRDRSIVSPWNVGKEKDLQALRAGRRRVSSSSPA